ncbi:MAG: outer membrane protein assembly factor BamD [Candidatus Acidiferrales bacterium]
METIHKKLRRGLIAGLSIFLLAGAAFAAGDTKDTKKSKNKKAAPAAGDSSAEPDKLLYDRAMADYKHGKYTVERLSLQTLINTYPDSEYLAKAKLAIGDSYYKEGGTTNLTESIDTYKDFITFFPFLDEAAYAQMQVAMAHYRMMEKADRDNSHAESAEDAFQTFILKYPNSPLVPKAEQHLREVQEIIADGDFRVASFYYLKGIRSYRASLARLNEIIERYPLYSQSDEALWMAGNIYEKAERRETADQLYARIVREYPTSKLSGDAKKKLTAANFPIPQPDPAAQARAANEKKYLAERPGMLKRTMGVIHSGPDFSTAAHSGQPNLQPPAESESATDVLRPGSKTPGSVGAGGGSGNSIAVETVPAGSSESTGDSSATPASTGSAPATDAPAAVPDNGSLPAPMNLGTTPSSETAAPAAEPETPATAATETAPAAATPDATAVMTSGGSVNGSSSGAANPPATGNGTASGTASTAAAKTSSEQTAASAEKPDPKSESSSKKKKGLKKLIPW